MNKKIYLIAFFTTTMLFSSCIWDVNDDDGGDPFGSSQSNYEAVIIPRETFETSTQLLYAKQIEETGKIYVKDQYLLINEPNKGFHIYNNSDPANPTKIKFLKVLGSSDISIKNNVLYINNAVDLIALTFNSDFSDIQITKRIKDVFPVMLSPEGFYPNPGNDEVVIDWTLIN